MFFSKRLKKFKNIKHCFFSRKNGFSSGIYKSLNCGMGSSDKKENVLKNIEYVSQKISSGLKSVITLNQKHSNRVVYFKNGQSVKNKLAGDAIVSKVKNVGIGILAADCAPILFYDPKKKIIGCAHAGWKGAFNGIIQNTLKKFNQLNSKNEDLIVVVGPCIKQDNYEVKVDFFTKFVEKNYENVRYFARLKKNGKYSFDLRGYINKELYNLNVKNIENLELDTFSKKDLFYSYRRSAVNKEKDYGRCISVILMT